MLYKLNKCYAVLGFLFKVGHQDFGGTLEALIEIMEKQAKCDLFETSFKSSKIRSSAYNFDKFIFLKSHNKMLSFEKCSVKQAIGTLSYCSVHLGDLVPIAN